MIKDGCNYVAIYKDPREPNPYRIQPAICGAAPGDGVTFANHTDGDVLLDFANWPFNAESSPRTLEAGAVVTLTVGKVKPGDIFPYAARCNQGQIEAEGSRPIIIIYK